MASVTNPAQFLVGGREMQVNSTLVDPQGWDRYWELKVDLDAAAYEIIAWAYRTAIIRPRLERYIRKHFPRGSELIHAGCGSGQVDRTLQREMKLTALDICVPALRLYARNNPDSVRLIHGSILDIPLPDGGHGLFEELHNFSSGEALSNALQRRSCRYFGSAGRGGKAIIFWPHQKGTSVAALKAIHWFRQWVMGRQQQLHAPEISLLPSRIHALDALREAGFEPIDYDFGCSDFWVQAVVVGQKPLSKTQSHRQDFVDSHEFISRRSIALR